VVLGLTQSLNSIAAIVAPAVGGLLIDHSLLAPWALLAAGISGAALFF
jgi:fucose permease